MSVHFDLTEKLLNKIKDDNHENKVGRYSCSKIWGILNGYMTPEQYIKGEEVSVLGATRMSQGKLKHKFLEDIFKDEYETEVKKEFDVGEFKIVGIADILDLGGKNVCDFKTSDALKEGKRWDLYQVFLYCTIFDRPKGIILQPRFTEEKIWLENIGTVKRNDKKFYKEMEKLSAFHKKVKKLCNTGAKSITK